jgi:hypothetical protein
MAINVPPRNWRSTCQHAAVQPLHRIERHRMDDSAPFDRLGDPLAQAERAEAVADAAR